MRKCHFFDSASTTKCAEVASTLVSKYSMIDYGNPSSAHPMGKTSAKAIREAHYFFSEYFSIQPEQVIFTGSGTEANNLAIYGIAMNWLAKRIQSKKAPRMICSSVEHSAVKSTMQSLQALGFDIQIVPVNSEGQIVLDKFNELLTPETLLISVMSVNNVVGTKISVEDLALLAKKKVPGVFFHTDAVQAFGKVDVPKAQGNVDLVSISAHKIEGPKGVGALIVLNNEVLKQHLRPIIWGGAQESGYRAGSQNAGLISGFHAAADITLRNKEVYEKHALELQLKLKEGIVKRALQNQIHWNSPSNAVPHINNLSILGIEASVMARMLADLGFMVSTGSACSSHIISPCTILQALGYSQEITSSGIRISTCWNNSLSSIDDLLDAIVLAIEKNKSALQS
jgi:cysteine desulfurase